jgi:hypothetical protein
MLAVFGTMYVTLRKDNAAALGAIGGSPKV